MLHDGRNTPEEPAARRRGWQQGWHRLPHSARAVVPRLFPIACHCWERDGEVLAGDPPHLPSTSPKASPKPPQRLGHSATVTAPGGRRPRLGAWLGWPRVRGVRARRTPGALGDTAAGLRPQPAP